MVSRFERRLATRQRLIDAVLSLLATKSYKQITLDEVGQKAGNSKGAVYFHFENKEALLVALVRYLGELKLLWPPFPKDSQELVGLTESDIESIVFEILVESRHDATIRNLLLSYNSKPEAELVLDLGRLVQHQVLALPV